MRCFVLFLWFAAVADCAVFMAHNPYSHLFDPKEVECVGGVALVRGDIAIGECTVSEPNPDGEPNVSGNVLSFSQVSYSEPWPHGILYYRFATINKDGTPETYLQVLEAVKHWNEMTETVELREWDGKAEYYVSIVKALEACWSYVGRLRSSGQELGLDPDGKCGFGATVHEFGHALGLLHEHSRTDRGSFVDILEDNVESDKLENFAIDETGDVHGNYDYSSNMHYGRYAFTKAAGFATVVPKADKFADWRDDIECPSCDIGQRRGLSAGDIATINTMYSKCEPTLSSNEPYSCPTRWSACSSNCTTPGLQQRTAFCHESSGACSTNTALCAAIETTRPCGRPLNCSFDDGYCAWSSHPTDGWHLGTADGSNYYAVFPHYLNAGLEVALESTVTNFTEGSSISFDYYRYGSNPGSFKLYLEPCLGSKTQLLDMTTNEYAWKNATVVIPSAENAKLKFEIVASSSTSDAQTALANIVVTIPASTWELPEDVVPAVCGPGSSGARVVMSWTVVLALVVCSWRLQLR